MRILVLHAWLKGNLGDVLQLSVLLSALRELNVRVLDLAGYPPEPAPETAELLALADRYRPDTFPWYWHLVHPAVGGRVFEPWWRRQRERLFAQYDAIVCAPGPYLADYDPRATSALADIDIAARMRVPVILSSHSVGPLRPQRLASVGRASLRIAREVSTFRYLEARGLSSVLAADYAFLYPYRSVDGMSPLAPPYRLVFLRSNNLDAGRLRVAGGALLEGDRVIAGPAPERLVLATSDRRRDGPFLETLSRRLALQYVACGSVAELVRLVAASSAVVTDRYHPAICAACLGKPAYVIPNREPHKMHGLTDLLTGNTLAELQRLARTGLCRVQEAIRTA